MISFVITSWIPEVHNIYYQGCRRKLLPASSKVAKLQSFFNCVAALMTSLLQNLAIDSMKDYTNLISQDTVVDKFQNNIFLKSEEWM